MICIYHILPKSNKEKKRKKVTNQRKRKKKNKRFKDFPSITIHFFLLIQPLIRYHRLCHHLREVISEA